VLVIVCYDVSTETGEGRRRLRRVAKICESFGQRVQKSVFECRVEAMLFEELERQLLDIIDTSEDCLRFYRLVGRTKLHVKEYGVFRSTDFDSSLVI
jgi:CRISPR-associated protein Cas2